jgi:hypothetical protein
VTASVYVRRLAVSIGLALFALFLAFPARSQPTDAGIAEAPALVIPAPPANPPLNEERILGLMPDYQTVRNPDLPTAPLTAKQKWILAERETVDPFNIATAFMTAAFSQHDNQTPKYGEGWPNYGRRVGAALADFGTQNFFSAGLLASVLHQDPRYYRKGPESCILKRVVYSVSRLVIARQDSGESAFNSSGIFGMAMGIAASNAYYPAASVKWSVMAGRINSSLFGGVVGNLTSEFWPDLQQKFFRKHNHDKPADPH